MNKVEAIKLEVLFETGHLIMIDGHGYVDSEVTGIYRNDDDEICYSSEVFSERPLADVRMHNVRVYQPSLKWAGNSESIDCDLLENFCFRNDNGEFDILPDEDIFDEDE